MDLLRSVTFAALVLTASILLTPLAASGGPGPAAAVAPLASAPLDPASVGFGVASPAPTQVLSAPGSNVASSMAQHAMSAVHAAGLSPHVAFLPRPSATSTQVARSSSQGYVTPLYGGTPAPMGLAYYGLSEGSHGQVVPTTLNTTSLWGQVNVNGVGIQPLDLFQSSPDSYGIQLNAVLTNVTLFGTPGYQFWTQNVVEYYAQSDFLILVTNIWNFSGGPISANALYAHGAFGTNFYGALGFYYAQYFVPMPITQPFNLSLYMNSSVIGGRDAVNFTVALSGPGESLTLPYDYAVFNSTLPLGTPLTTPSNYTADGFSYNPLGLTNDFELILGGPGGGSQADLATADATLGLAYWNAALGAYEPTPTAYSYGGETGETVTGANVAWTSGSGGPGGLADWGTMSTGPSILRGLWNAGAPAGSYPVTLAVTPSNAFYVFTESNGSQALAHFLIQESVAAPGVYGNTFWLTPGTYRVAIGLGDYTPSMIGFTLTGPLSLTVHLKKDMREGVYTPLWAFSNAQLKAISSSGSGTSTNPYMLFNNQRGALSPVFGLYNDFTFPVYPGLFLHGTSAYVEARSTASFTTQTSDFQYPGPFLPATNQLQLWFWNVSHVALAHSEISGWFGSSAYLPVVFDTFNVIFYESSWNLIAANDFATEGQALLMFSGGTIFGPLNVGGGNNTVWGNRFTEPPGPNSTLGIQPIWSGLNVGLGMQIAESNDLIYNNYVATPTTAWLLPLNLYSGAATSYSATWNISVQKSSIAHYAAGFPLIPLVGSIVNSRLQGGNFWWDYGIPNPFNGANNPIGVLPYDENATTLILYVYGPSYYFSTYIYGGGDFAPLP
ncbi:MAG TPA: thermopsin family protease [Thermoplasmata archaeon]|nr:thermopsin family protease [Thermoplasmata archaeon]